MKPLTTTIFKLHRGSRSSILPASGSRHPKRSQRRGSLLPSDALAKETQSRVSSLGCGLMASCRIGPFPGART
ncbi:hypothetical protein chiPu_0024428 [Chiloscyllium punctatum]|uniref:Uncharacterized protein n=1 Tax=Chiloscyllium punctatum TaxID=137246 RepID=A0A401TC19_CHIPU|nr:hypothetical protein [Chiloscyllium punctatum]